MASQTYNPNPPPNPSPNPAWSAIDTYAIQHLHSTPSPTVPSDSALSHALQTSREAGLPDIAVSATQGKHLHLQARLLHAQHILEVGTLGGYSTIWLAHATPTTRVTTVEVNEHHAEVARRNLAFAGVGEGVDVILGTGVEVLSQLAEKGERFDMVFIDADKENGWRYFDLSVGMTREGGLVVVDNVVRRGALVDERNEDPRVKGSRELVEKVGRDGRVDATVLQTVGEKGYDGFLVAVVR